MDSSTLKPGALCTGANLRNVIFAIILGLRLVAARTFDISRSDNIVAIWGEGRTEKSITAYCDDTIDAITIGYVQYNGPTSLPSFTWGTDSIPGAGCGANVFPNSQLLDCPTFAADIKECQSKGKAVFLSLDPGIGSASDWYTTEADARAYATQLWVTFLGGGSDTLPFGDAVLDGLRVETPRSGDLTWFWAFFDQLRKVFRGAPKRFFLTAAVWCDTLESLGETVMLASLDALYLTVLQGPCSVVHYDDKTQWNYGGWETLLESSSLNTKAKIYFGIDATSDGQDYVNATRLGQIVLETRLQFPETFGGVVYGDAANAVANDNYQAQLRQALLVQPTSSVVSSPIPPVTPISSATTDPGPSHSPQPPAGLSRLQVILATVIPTAAVIAILLVALVWYRSRRNRISEALIRPYGNADDPRRVHRPVSEVAVGSENSKHLLFEEFLLSKESASHGATSSQTRTRSNLSSEDLQALQTEMGRVGLSVPALLSSLSRLRDPLPSAPSEAGTAVSHAPPRYE